MNMVHKDDVLNTATNANEIPVITKSTMSIPHTEDVGDFTFRNLHTNIEVTCPPEWKITHMASLIQEKNPNGALALDPIEDLSDNTFNISFPYDNMQNPHTDVITIEKGGISHVFRIETRVNLVDLVEHLNRL